MAAMAAWLTAGWLALLQPTGRVFGVYPPLCSPSVVGASRSPHNARGRATTSHGELVRTRQNLFQGSPFRCNLLFLF
jgi:hypothetical protein